MAGIDFNVAEVSIDASKIMELSIVANEKVEAREDGKYSLTTNFNSAPVRSVDGGVFLDLLIEIGSDGAPTYNTKIRTRTGFVFPEGSGEEAQNEYLRTIGTARAFDFARSYLQMITSFGAWGEFKLPGLPILE